MPTRRAVLEPSNPAAPDLAMSDPAALARDYQHRLRNLLAVIRSIVRRTAAASTDMEQFATHLDGRIGAIARVQSALARMPGGAVTLHSLLADELLAHATHEGRQASLSGPAVRLRGKPAETLALFIHELTVDAVTHGALAALPGRLAVEWRFLPSGELLFEWKESGARPGRSGASGFGREFGEEMLAYELGAHAESTPEPGGTRWTVRVPSHPDIVLEPA